MGRAEVADNRPDGADGFAVAVKPKQSGGGRRGAAEGRQKPATQLCPIVHRQFDLLPVANRLDRVW